jgi:RHS repeat-associated protein
MYDAFYRNLDPQIGRWLQIDPKSSESSSPYLAMDNNPMLKTDFLGDTT